VVEVASSGLTKPCRACGNQIPVSARKCSKCGSWQDWRAEIGISTDVLALLVALVTVLTAAIPVIISLLTPDQSRIGVSVARVATNEDYTDPEMQLQAYFTNSGNRPGLVIKRVIIEAFDANNQTQAAATANPEQPVQLEPGKSALVSIVFNVLPNDWADFRPVKCRAHFDVTNFDGSTPELSVPFDCAKLDVVWKFGQEWRVVRKINNGLSPHPQ
jgi:hypothetical protein